MTLLFATQVGLWENGKAEFMVTRPAEKKLEGTRVLATSEQNAKEVYLEIHKTFIEKKLKEWNN